MNARFSLGPVIRGNLKNRSKQYRSLFIGVTLAIAFVTMLVLIIASLPASLKQYHESRIGHHDMVVFDVDETVLQQLSNEDRIESYGLARVLGQTVPERDSQRPVTLASFTDEALTLLNAEVLEGRLPEAPGEIALESQALRTLRIPANLNELINIRLDLLSDSGADPVQGTEHSFTLVGVLADRNANLRVIMDSSTARAASNDYPQAIVAASQVTDQSIVSHLAYIELPEVMLRDENALQNLRADLGTHSEMTAYRHQTGQARSAERTTNIWLNVILGSIMALVLVLMAALAINNSLQSIMETNQRQLGLLRALGATRKQIRALNMTETLSVALLCSPLGMIIGTLLVLLIMRLIGPYLKFSANPLIYLAIGAFSIVVILIAAASVIRRASRTAPMQALRPTELTRPRKLKRIRSLATFQPDRLLAKRNLILYSSQGSKITIFLASAIILLAVPTLFISTSYKQLANRYYDIFVNQDTYSASGFIDHTYNQPGFTDSDIQEFLTLPNISEVNTTKHLTMGILIEDYTDYLTEGGFGPGYYLSGPAHWETTPSPSIRAYQALREKLDIEHDLFGSSLTALVDTQLMELEPYVYDGAINLEKINSGEEILMVAPTSFVYREERGVTHGWVREGQATPKGAMIYSNDMFRAGDTITLSFLQTDEPAGDYQTLPDRVNRSDRTVTIGAVLGIPPQDTPRKILFPYGTASLITGYTGFKSLGFDAPTRDVYLKVTGDLTEEAEIHLINRIEAIAYRVPETSVLALLDIYRSDRASLAAMVTAVLAVGSFFSMICAAMINNSTSARVRANKRSIATIRAVGASERTIYRSFTLQVLRLFIKGALLGFVMAAVLIYVSIIYGGAWYSHWAIVIPLVFTALILLVSLITTRIRVKQILRGSIVDNIRQF